MSLSHLFPGLLSIIGCMFVLVTFITRCPVKVDPFALGRLRRKIFAPAARFVVNYENGLV